jgi:hypothetical protein
LSRSLSATHSSSSCRTSAGKSSERDGGEAKRVARGRRASLRAHLRCDGLDASAGSGRARIELSIKEDGPQPLHIGTQATVRSTSLSGISNRYVALLPGPTDEPKIDDGGSIPGEGVHGEVDLDEVWKGCHSVKYCRE